MATSTTWAPGTRSPTPGPLPLWGRRRPGFRFHDLRHTDLARYAQQGAATKGLMARGGHRDMRAAMRYQRAEQERDRALTNRLDGII